MFSLRFRKSGWLRNFLLSLAEKPVGVPLKTRSTELSADFGDQLDQSLYQQVKKNGLLLGCPVVTVQLADQARELGFPEKTGETLLLYLDTLFKVSLEKCVLAGIDKMEGRANESMSVLEIHQLHLATLIPLTLRYHLPNAFFRIPHEQPLQEMLHHNETLHSALNQFEEVLLEQVTLKGYSSEGNRQNLFAFLQLYCCLRWINGITHGTVPSLEMMIQTEYQLRKELILAFSALIWADGKVTRVERQVFSKYIIQTGLPQTFQDELAERVKRPVGIEELTLSMPSTILRFFLIEQLILLSLINSQDAWQEQQLIADISNQLGLSEPALQRLYVYVADFFAVHAHRFAFLRNNPSTQQFQDYMHDKVTLQVKKNLDRIVKEIKDTKELYELLMKATNEPLSQEEKQKVQEQLMDIVKTIPALAIFALPGGGILLPILIKVLPFNILPSAFADDPHSA